MAFVIADRVRETTTTIGTGSITLAGAYTSFQSFSAAIGNGNNTYYTIASASSGEWEVGIGTYSSGGNLLSRDTVLSSSNAGSLVNFSVGSKDVFVTQPASRAIFVQNAGTGLQTGTTAFTASRVLYANATSTTTTSANLTFDGTTLTANALTTTSTVTINGGTANGVAYLNGSKVLTTGSALTYNGSTLQNTTSAGGISAVFTDATYSTLKISHADTTGNIALLNGANQNYAVFGSASIFYASSTEGMRLTSTGLGIGTSSPSTLLHGSSGRSILTWNSTTTNNDAMIALTNSTDSSRAEILANKDGTGGATYLSFGTRNTSGSTIERARIDSSGNLGLGVTPSASNLAGFLEGGYGTFGQTTSLGTSIAGNAYYNSGWKYKLSSTATLQLQDSSGFKWYTAASGTAGNTITFTQAMTLDASGNLGVGTSSPSARLTAKAIGNAYANSAALSLVSTASQTSYITNVGGALYVSNDGSTDQLVLSSSGNLGIGTSSPSRKLTVFGSDGVPFFNVNGYDVASWTGATLDFGGMTAAQWNTLRFFTSGSERMRLDTSGNLGLGVTPSAWESTAKAFQFGSLGYVARGSSGQTMLGYNNYLNTSNQYIYSATSQASRYEQISGEHRWFNAASGTAGNAITFTQAMTLDDVGRLNIGGTASPGAYRLAITGDSASYMGGIIFRQSSTDTLYLGNIAANNTIDFEMWNPRNGYIRFATNNTERMRLDSSGNLGLGVTPSAWTSGYKVLQVSDRGSHFASNTTSYSSAPYLFIGNNGYGNSGAGFAYTISQPSAQYRQVNAEHQWFNAASGTAGNAISFTQAMTLDANGALLIGQTSWSFSNNGTQIQANGRIFNTSSTDYNFELAGAQGGRLRFYTSAGGSGTTVGSITVDTTSTQYNTSSDYRLKNITGPVTNSGAYIDSLRPVEGTWKSDGSTFVGLIAHEVQEASRTNVATGVKDGPEMQAMDYSSAEIIANLIAELQSLRARVAQLESKGA